MSFAVGLSTPQPRSPSVMALHYTARGRSIIEALSFAAAWLNQ
jgi:hypothetical protein